MGATAFLCILTGVYPQLLCAILPYPVHFEAYTPDKIVVMIQLLLFTGAAFWLFIDKLGGEPTISMDTDWFYRMFSKGLLWFCNRPLNEIRSGNQGGLSRKIFNPNHLSGNPYWIPKLVSFFLQGGGEKSYKAIWGESYQVNSYRLSIGIAVAISVIFLFAFALLLLAAGA